MAYIQQILTNVSIGLLETIGAVGATVEVVLF